MKKLLPLKSSSTSQNRKKQSQNPLLGMKIIWNQVEDLRSEVDVNVSGKTASELLARFKTSAIQKDVHMLS